MASTHRDQTPTAVHRTTANRAKPDATIRRGGAGPIQSTSNRRLALAGPDEMSALPPKYGPRFVPESSTRLNTDRAQPRPPFNSAAPHTSTASAASTAITITGSSSSRRPKLHLNKKSGRTSSEVRPLYVSLIANEKFQSPNRVQAQLQPQPPPQPPQLLPQPPPQLLPQPPQPLLHGTSTCFSTILQTFTSTSSLTFLGTQTV